MVALVALRLGIGWHFFKEGLNHRNDSNWSSEGFLKQAKGPLAERYQSIVPRFHDWDRLMLSKLVDNGSAAEETDEATVPAKDKAADKGDKSEKKANPAYADWLDQVKVDWKAEQDAFADFYKLTDDQRTKAGEITNQSIKQMEDVLKGYADDIRLYRQLVYRADMMQATPGGGEIPFIKARAAVVQKNPVGEVGLTGTSTAISSPPPAWQADAKDIENLWRMKLADLLTSDQQKLGAPTPDTTKLHKIDQLVIWGLIAVGGCLIIGLFTRLAALAGAVFLLSIVLTQPPWYPGTVETYNQVVEMLALVALSTTAVGRWGGLDYFIYLLVKPIFGRRTIKEQA